MIKEGSKVKLRNDVLPRHAKSVPAHIGYTTSQFEWRDTLRKLKGRTGTVTKTFPSSTHVNVKFGKTLIGIGKNELVEVK